MDWLRTVIENPASLIAAREAEDAAVLDALEFEPIKSCWNPDHISPVDAVWIASNCVDAYNVCDQCKVNAHLTAQRVVCTSCSRPASLCWRFHPIGGTS